jgi:hypothetical protein
MGDPFTSTIFRWLNCVAADPTLPPAAFKLAYIISQHINRARHDAWPSQATLKDALGLKDERSVRRLTDALENRGYIIARRRKQASMLYRLAQDRTELSYQGQVQNQTEDEARPDISDRSSAQDRTIFAPRPVNSVPQDRTELSAKPLNEPMKNQGRAHATLIPDDFELSEETHNWAIDRLGSNEAVARSVERFINHFRQVEGRTAKSRDWDAKVRNWIDEDARKTALHKKQISSERPSAITDDHWRAVLKTYVGTKHWTQHATLFGPEPSSPNCRAPAHLLLEYGIRREAVA